MPAQVTCRACGMQFPASDDPAHRSTLCPRCAHRMLQDIAERVGYPGDAAVAVMLLLEGRVQVLRDGQEPVARRVTARELCENLLQSETAASWGTLRQLRLLTSEDVGRVVYALVEEGLIAAQMGESEADFIGLFDLRSE